MLFEDEYKTIEAKVDGLFKDRGSKFLAFAYPVSTEKEAKEIINEIRKEYHDACHHCYAYRIGSDKLLYRTSDDGEPSGTAGKPIFNQILSKDLTNILIIVVRYFGGTLLGVPGLINAYKTSAINALSSAVIVSKTVNEVYELIYDYPVMNEVMKIMKDKGLEIKSTDFSLLCKIIFSVRKNDSLNVYEMLRKISSLKIKYLYTE
ncbi:MAG TPA: YigZ family protein [Bacteroidales bacterium]|nr:YigZ family protein [Bacteroidales bacterium]HPS46237.1 YigZ family protein [Bacteroidales bacterium]HQH18911.1 YigZ family protein [Bacteroidales bacterium]HQI45869.1 YigZ family protein [Bacteroidales bacterium]